MEYYLKLRVTGFVDVVVEAEDEEDARETALSMTSDELLEDVTDIEVDVEEIQETE
jgi:hypothetical protein